jgi:hypothetical protein
MLHRGTESPGSDCSWKFRMPAMLISLGKISNLIVIRRTPIALVPSMVHCNISG